MVRQGQLDVLEVEVDTEGRWRYTGNTSAPWNDISADPAMVTPLAPPSAPGFEDAEVRAGLSTPLRRLALSSSRPSMCSAIACRTMRRILVWPFVPCKSGLIFRIWCGSHRGDVGSFSNLGPDKDMRIRWGPLFGMEIQ